MQPTRLHQVLTVPNCGGVGSTLEGLAASPQGDACETADRLLDK